MRSLNRRRRRDGRRDRIRDVEQEAVPFARAAGEAEGRIDGDVVALAERAIRR